MAKLRVLVEVDARQSNAFAMFSAATASVQEAGAQVQKLADDIGVRGFEIEPEYVPVPMFADEDVFGDAANVGFAAFNSPTTSPDLPSASVVVAAQVDEERLDDLRSRPGVTVYPNSELTLLQGSVDCRPFRAAVPIGTIRALLGAPLLFAQGFFGQQIIVGIIDEGVNGQVYPVVGGFSMSAVRRPGTAPITSHGSMCAADVLVAAPCAQLYDYPFLGVPDSGGALAMYQAILDQRRRDGTPHLTNNSYGFVGVPPKELMPTHEIHDINHPLHRKIREVIASGAPAFFAAGNCGVDCPSGRCQASGIGPGQSIHASNSLVEVITVAAVNSRHERIGYSSQGPGMFERQKPDMSAYSHFLGNFGPGRPGGVSSQLFDNGTSAACPVAAGVGALLMSAIPGLTPARLKEVLMTSALPISGDGWNADTGHGVVNAAAAFAALAQQGGSAASVAFGGIRQPAAMSATAGEAGGTGAARSARRERDSSRTTAKRRSARKRGRSRKSAATR